MAPKIHHLQPPLTLLLPPLATLPLRTAS